MTVNIDFKGCPYCGSFDIEKKREYWRCMMCYETWDDDGLVFSSIEQQRSEDTKEQTNGISKT